MIEEPTKAPRQKLVVSDASQMHGLLRARFKSPEYAYLTEVASNTGAGQQRWADAVIMGLWPSRGVDLHGVEIKVSRSDWMQEKKNPEKADRIARYCDRWWLAVANDDIVRDGELPENWGLMVARGTKIIIAKDAPKLTPQPMDRTFLAALMRKIDAKFHSESRDSLMLQEYRRGEERGRVDSQVEMNHLREQLRELREQVQKFQVASGVKIDSWRFTDMSAAINALIGGKAHYEFESHRGKLDRLLRDATSICKGIEQSIKHESYPPELVEYVI